MFCRVSTHLIGPSEAWLIFYFLQNLVHRLPKHSANYLGSNRSSMPSKISSRSVIIVPLWLEILTILRNYFGFPLSLLLVLFCLDGNTLHIKVSFFEWTTILWLKWLTCSIRSVLPLYMINAGWVNRWRSFPPSILCVKGDLEIWCKALLITSLPRPLWDGLLLLRL